MTGQPVEDFLAELSAELAAAGIGQPRIAEICAEVEDHLRESARALQLQGRPSAVAWQQAVARFGEPAELAQRFARAIKQGDSALWRLASLLTRSSLGSEQVQSASHIADPQSRKGLQILLETFAQRARRLGCDSLDVGGSGFGTARQGLPASCPHLIEGLQDFGFEVEQSGVLLHAPLQEADPGRPPVIDGLTLRWRLDPEAPEWLLHALLDGRQIDECGVWGLSRHVADRSDYQHWINFEWTEVEEPYQRRGIGSWLVREQMRMHRERGARRALRWEWLTDPVALSFYEALGFERRQEWWKYRKEGL
ncbi:MAG: hypothetical protein CL878_05220 [Dehalococcoidia bacterium]|nr:hypothetical protein [Dehalococcoidia bacterium]